MSHPVRNLVRDTASACEAIATRAIPDSRLSLVRLANQTIRPDCGVGPGFEEMADALPALVWAANGRGQLIYVNSYVMQSFQWRPVDLLGWAWKNMVHPDDLPITVSRWESAMTTAADYEIEHRFRGKDGEYRWLLSKVQPVRENGGDIRYWCGHCVDVTHRRALEQSVEELNERLIRSSHLGRISELAAAIIHEVNQPLAAMLINAQACQNWLRSNPSNMDRALVTLDKIVRDGDAVIDVTRRTRALYQNAASKKVPTNLAIIVERMRESFAPSCLQKAIELELPVRQGLPTLLVDPVQMGQVFSNLLRNAVEAVEQLPQGAGRKISMTCDVVGSYARIGIVDTGQGLSDPAAVFEPFFTTKERGMGMGLTICRLIVEAHEGKISASRSEVTGTTFSILVPIQSPAHARSAGPVLEPAVSSPIIPGG